MKKILFMTILLFPSMVYCAGWERYVNTAALPGGNGMTNATTGDNRAYASLNEAEAVLNGVLTDPCTIYCYGVDADTTTITFAGWTMPTSTTSLRIIGDWDGSKYDTSKYRIAPPSGDCVVIGANCNKIRFSQIQFSTEGDADGEHCVELSNNGGPVEYYFNRCYFRRNLQNRGNQNGLHTASGMFDSVSSKLYIRNCIFTRVNSGIYFQASGNSANPLLYVQNNTWVSVGGAGYGYGVERAAGSGTWDFRNNLFYNSKTADTQGNDPETADYNSTNASSLGYTANTHDHVSHTFSFESITETTDGFAHIVSTDTGALNLGVDLSSVFALDVDGETRTGTWDIGADEYKEPIESIIFKRHLRLGGR